jgi:hypothetical protein
VERHRAVRVQFLKNHLNAKSAPETAFVRPQPWGSHGKMRLTGSQRPISQDLKDDLAREVTATCKPVGMLPTGGAENRLFADERG